MGMFEQLTNQEISMLKLKICNGRDRIWEVCWPAGSKTVYVRMAVDATRLITEIWGVEAAREWK